MMITVTIFIILHFREQTESTAAVGCPLHGGGKLGYLSVTSQMPEKRAHGELQSAKSWYEV